MPLPKRNLRGQTCTVTMMELRAQPGEVLDAVRDGMLVRITRQGKHVATMMPPGYDPDAPTIIHPDGSFEGPPPLSFRRPELLRGAGY